MVKWEQVKNDLTMDKIYNSYIFYGVDEELINEYINIITSKVFKNNDAFNFNCIKLDGSEVTYEEIFSNCETLPLFSEKKIIIVYRASFLNGSDKSMKIHYNDLLNYTKNLPTYTILIMYYVLQDEREKPSEFIKKLDKHNKVIKVDKLKGDLLLKKAENIFKKNNKEINKMELKYFCQFVKNDISSLKNEIEKLTNYTYNRDITKDSIDLILSQSKEKDIFELVEFISTKKLNESIEILNYLIYSGESILGILFMIERQFILLTKIKISLDENKSKDEIVKELKIHPYVYDKLSVQCRKFKNDTLLKILKICLDTENNMKSTNLEKKSQLELLIINSLLTI